MSGTEVAMTTTQVTDRRFPTGSTLSVALVVALAAVVSASIAPLTAVAADSVPDRSDPTTVPKDAVDLTDEQLQALGLTEDDLPEIEAEFAQVLTADETAFLRQPFSVLSGILYEWVVEQPMSSVPTDELDAADRSFIENTMEISEAVASAGVDGEDAIRHALLTDPGEDGSVVDEGVVDEIFDAYAEQVLALDALEQRYRPELNPIQEAAWSCDIDPDGNVEVSEDGTAAVLRLGEYLRRDDQECMLAALDIPLFALDVSGAHEFDGVTMIVDDEDALLSLG
jgi:hypothetical protein